MSVTVSAAGYLAYTDNIVVLQTENPTVIGLEPDGIDPTPIPTPIDTPLPTPTPTFTPAPGLRGDVNDDDSIDIIDALLVAQYYVGLNPQNFNAGNADANCDDFIDIIDALLIAQYYVGLVTQFC